MALKKLVTAEDVFELLNELLEIDRDFIQELVSARINCNKAMADHPTVQVLDTGSGGYKTGIIGILNGLFGIREDGFGAICVYLDENGNIERFGPSPEKTEKDK